jgi:hypothetical protein
LDHVGTEQHAQAQAARAQFDAATDGLADARFATRTGDPLDVLLELLNDPATDLLVFGRRTFQVSGRPSLKGVPQRLAKLGRRPLLLLP